MYWGPGNVERRMHILKDIPGIGDISLSQCWVFHLDAWQDDTCINSLLAAGCCLLRGLLPANFSYDG